VKANQSLDNRIDKVQQQIDVAIDVANIVSSSRTIDRDDESAVEMFKAQRESVKRLLE
jgi:hypothetical protein